MSGNSPHAALTRLPGFVPCSASCRQPLDRPRRPILRPHSPPQPPLPPLGTACAAWISRTLISLARGHFSRRCILTAHTSRSAALPPPAAPENALAEPGSSCPEPTPPSALQSKLDPQQLLKTLASTEIINSLLAGVVGIFGMGWLLFALEVRQNPHINNIDQGVYLAVVTLTTVGFGGAEATLPWSRFRALDGSSVPRSDVRVASFPQTSRP